MSDTTALITLDLRGLSASLTQQAEVIRAKALEASALIGKVNDAATNAAAVEAQVELARTLKVIEDARKAAKDPILKIGRSLDDRVAAFIAELKAEQLRLARLVGDFQKLEEAKRRAAEEARLAEQRRIEEERRAAELAALRAAEMERQRIAAEKAELERLAAQATEKERQRIAEAQRELERQQALANAKSHDELDRINEAASNAAKAVQETKVEPVRATGQQVTEDWEITVTDIWLLARAHPSCVKIEALNGEIKSLLKAGVSVKGVKAEKVTRATVRVGRQREAINV